MDTTSEMVKGRELRNSMIVAGSSLGVGMIEEFVVKETGTISHGQHLLLWFFLYYFYSAFDFFFLLSLGVKEKEPQNHEFSTAPNSV